MGMHGANLDYMKSLSTAGYRVGNTHRLVTLRDHGVSREFIGGLTDAGYRNLSLDDLQELRDHGVTPDFIASLRQFGFTGLTTDQLLEARDHGVTKSFLEDFRELGYTNLSLRDFVRMRDHGVTPGFARQQRSSNGRLLSVAISFVAEKRGLIGMYAGNDAKLLNVMSIRQSPRTITRTASTTAALSHAHIEIGQASWGGGKSCNSAIHT